MRIWGVREMFHSVVGEHQVWGLEQLEIKMFTADSKGPWRPAEV